MQLINSRGWAFSGIREHKLMILFAEQGQEAKQGVIPVLSDSTKRPSMKLDNEASTQIESSPQSSIDKHNTHPSEAKQSNTSCMPVDLDHSTDLRVLEQHTTPRQQTQDYDGDQALWSGGPEILLLSNTRELEALGDVGDLAEMVQHTDIPARYELMRKTECPRDRQSAWVSWLSALSEHCDMSKKARCLSLAIMLTPDDHPNKPGRLNDLGNIYGLLFNRFGKHDDLSRANSYHSQAVALTPDGHPGKSSRLNNLGNDYHSLFKAFGRHDDISRAIEYHTQAVALTPDGRPDKTAWLNSLGNDYQSLFKVFGRRDDISRAVDCHSQAVALTPGGHPGKPMGLSSLGNAYYALFKTFGRHDDLSRAVDCHSQAVALTPDSHPDKPARLNNLGNDYQSLSETFGRHEDMRGAVDCRSRAVALTPNGHPGKPIGLSNLGNAYQLLFKTFGRHDDMTRAVDCHSQAVALTPDDHPDKHAWLNNLGSDHQLLFERFGRHDDLSRAVDCHSQAAALTPDSHPGKPALLSSLGTSYYLLFKTFSRRDNISRAIDYHTQAVALTPDGHPDKTAWLNNLANTYQLLFETFGRRDDMSRAVDCRSQVVSLAPDRHPDKPAWLNNLGNSYQSLFKVFSRHDDISRAVDCHNQAVALTPEGHPSKPGWLNNLGNAYRLLFKAFSRHDDLSRAVDCHSQALALTPDGHPEKHTRLNNLGDDYQLLFVTFGRHEDISRAIDYHSQTVALAPDGHPSKPGWLSDLGDAYRLQLKTSNRHHNVNDVVHLHSPAVSGSPASSDIILKSLCAYRDAALMHTGLPSVRLRASRMWAKLSSSATPSSFEAHTRCMQLLSEAVWLGGSVHDRFVCLEGQARHLVAEAVASAIAMHKYDTAIEWLEQGRCMVWTQLLELRMPLDELRDAHPEAADKLRRLSLLLEHSPLSSSDEATPEVAQRHRQAADQRDQLIEEIRQLAEFEGFLQPPKAAQLMSYVLAHATVVVNVSPERCDALVIQYGAQSIKNIPLPDFSYQQAVNARTELFDRLKTRNSERGVKQHRTKPEMSIEQVLAALWYKVAQPVLGYLGISDVRPIDELPHIVWCVTGALSFLPVHAAGDYTSGDPSTVMHNLVVSSYTPNLSTLDRLATPSAPFSGMLAVGVSLSVRGAASLPKVKHELDHVHRRFEDVKYTCFNNEEALTDGVLEAMASHSWVHLACHGSQDPKNPLKSAFHLYDAELDLATISRTQLPHADFAFLSACKTAAGDAELPDEAVHLAAGLLMAGYKSVIASMWAIHDEHAPQVADSVYEYMLGTGTPDSRKAARALHKAMVDLREVIGVDKYDAWVPYIHMGC